MSEPEVLWEPTETQRKFLRCPFFLVLFGGAAGGGKTDALLIDAIGQADNPKYRALLVRRSYPELTEMIRRAKELYPIAFPGARYNQTDKCWTFPDGGRVEFGYLEQDDDVYRYHGQAYTYMGFDEITHYSEWAFNWMLSRVRTTDPTLKCYVRCTGNPGGPHHHWVKAYFVDPAPPMTPVHDDRTGTTRVYIPSLIADNPYLASTDYASRLMALPDADRKALLEGRWDAYQGTVFNLERGIHIWSWAEFKARTGHDEIPKEWTKFRALDWGYAKPFSVGWYAMDYDGRLYKYREWYGVERDSKGQIKPDVGVRLTPEQVAKGILERDKGDKIHQTVADPSCWARGRGDQKSAPSISERMWEEGVFLSPGKNDRIQGKMQMHSRLDYEADETGTILEYPGLILIGEECLNTIRTIPALEYSESHVEDIDTDMEDHAYDETRYMMMSRPWQPKVKKLRPKWLEREDDRKDWGWTA